MSIEPVDPKTLTPGYWWARWEDSPIIVYVQRDEETGHLSTWEEGCIDYAPRIGEYEFFSKIEIPEGYEEACANRHAKAKSML